MSKAQQQPAAASVITSVNLADLSLEQIVQLSQGLGHQIEKLREQRAYLRKVIDDRLAQGERTATDQAVDGSAQAPGAVIDTRTA